MRDSFGYLIERPIRKSSPLPTSTKGILSSVCELPLPSSLVQTSSVLSSIEPAPPGSGVSASRLTRYASCSQYQRLILVSFSWASSFAVRLRATARDALLRRPANASCACPTELVNCSVATRAKSAAKAVDHQVDLHLADSRHVVVLVFDAGLQFRHGVTDLLADSLGSQLLLHLAHERRMLVQQFAVFGADRGADLVRDRPARRPGRSSDSPGLSSDRTAWRTSGTDRRSGRSACWDRRKPCASRCRPARARPRRIPASRNACASRRRLCRKFLIS